MLYGVTAYSEAPYSATGAITATASISAGEAAISGQGQRVVTSTGALQPAAASVSGAGQRVVAGSGLLVSGSASISGVAVIVRPGKRAQPFIPDNRRDEEKQYRGKELAETGRETKPEMRQRINNSHGRTNNQLFRRTQSEATRNNTTNGRR